MKRLAALILLAGWIQLAGAIDSAPAFDDPVQQERYSKIIHELRCVQCRSQSIADSNVSLAADLRRQVRELMAAGKSDAEITQYMRDRYGDYVLYDPPFNSSTWLLWTAPLILAGVGAVVAVIVIRRKSKLPEDGDAGEDHGVPAASDTGAP